MTPEEVAAQAADANHYNYVIECQQQMLTTSKTFTVCQKMMLKGNRKPGGKGHTAYTPALPPPVTPVMPGIEKRFRKLVRQIKNNLNYTSAIGVELNIEAIDHAAPDMAAVQPALSAVVIGNYVELRWSWRGHRAHLDLRELEVDRGDGKGFVWLVSTIKTRYRAGDQIVGQRSTPASVMVPP